MLAEPLADYAPADVKEGTAEIFTTIKGTKLNHLQFEITKVEKEQFQFNLTDPKLLAATGGILQGMSGSPVIQNGKFVGAVTHMFVDEPRKRSSSFFGKDAKRRKISK